MNHEMRENAGQMQRADLTSPVRVLHILGSAQRGGTESVVFNYYRSMDHSKVSFDIAIDDNSPCDLPKDVLSSDCEIYKIPPYTRLPAYLNAIDKICREGDYRIIHSHMNALSVFPLFAAWRAGVPVRIAHSHSTAGGGMDFKRDMIKYALRPFSRLFATHYIACSEHAGRWLFGDAPFTLMPNAIDTERFAYNPNARDAFRKELGLENKFVIGHVGRFSPQKNHDFLLDIFGEACKQNDNCVLMLIGGLGSAGTNIEKNLREKVGRMNLTERVLFLGTREDISGVYQAMDVFVLPSLYEGLPVTVIEAQTAGLPCILSDRITREVKITEDACFLSLRDPLSVWAERILSFRGAVRRSAAEETRKAGFEICEQATKYQNFILSLRTPSDRAKKK